jgi:23S rRNA (cytosine1962-C5)-methyltransferase
MAGQVVLGPGPHERIRAGHPWIYRSEIADVRGRWAPGEVLDVLDAAGRFVGRGTYNPRTTLACRLLTRRNEPVDRDFCRRRIAGALRHRQAAGLDAEAMRLVWSEADGLPGLVVDAYGPVTVIQCLTAGTARMLPWIAAALAEARPADRLCRIDDPTAARIEGFTPHRCWLSPDGTAGPDLDAEPASVVVAEGACRFAVALGRGHKTGLYLDQRENRAAVAARAQGARVLDTFCYTGGFACHALAAGAASALLIDASADALAVARENLELNGVAERAELLEENAFDALRQLEARRERFGLIVLDPPPFTRRKESLEAASRGYKDINLRAARLLEPGGILATFCCSHHITPAFFESICREAAGDAGRALRVLSTLTQAPDHPVLLNVPESRYLTGLLLQAV